MRSPQSQNRDGVQAAKTFQQAIKMLEDLLPFYDQLAVMMVLPWKEFDAQYPEFVKKAQAASPLAADFFGLPIMDQVVARERRYQTQMALFKAALAVVQSGPDQLKDIKDPFDDGPFEYRALDKGFELKSKLTLSREARNTDGRRREEGIGSEGVRTVQPTRSPDDVTSGDRVIFWSKGRRHRSTNERAPVDHFPRWPTMSTHGLSSVGLNFECNSKPPSKATRSNGPPATGSG